MLTNRACTRFHIRLRIHARRRDVTFRGGSFISNATRILRQLTGLTPSGSGGILNPILTDSCLWYRGLLSKVRDDLSRPARGPITSCLSFPFPTEATMSAKKRRKIYGVRRETRRPRGWTRWFQEGLFETESSNSIRLRTTLWGQK